MKEVIYIKEGETAAEKPVEFTHFLTDCEGWVSTTYKPNLYYKVVYLGKCDSDGDMFSAFDGKYIRIYKGHLNSGKY